MREIERRFLANDDAVQRSTRSVEVCQAYLLSSRSGQVRIRSISTGEYWLTIKRLLGNTLLERSETEVALTAKQFEILSSERTGNQIRKTRHYIPLPDGLVAELDRFHDQLEGLVIAEVEFESVDASNRFSPPTWLGQEITEDERYLNSTLALQGRPGDAGQM